TLTLPSHPTRRSSDLQNRLPGFIDDRLICRRIEPTVLNSPQDGESDHRCSRELRIRARIIDNLPPETVRILKLDELRHVSLIGRSEEHTSELQSPDHL